jgi:hypothetical protein
MREGLVQEKKERTIIETDEILLTEMSFRCGLNKLRACVCALRYEDDWE